jgi:hypothetical protein
VLPRGYSEVRKNIDNSVQLQKKDNNPEARQENKPQGYQKTEVRRQKSEDRRQRSEDRRQTGKKSEVRSQKTEAGTGTGDRGRGRGRGQEEPTTRPGCHGQR